MAQTYTRNSNILSFKDVSFAKPVVLEEPETANPLTVKQTEIERQLLKLEKQHKEMLVQTETDKQKILEEAKKASLEIEKNAYEEGYAQGLKNGHEDGYKEAYDKRMEETKEEFDSMIDEATKILLSSQSLVSDYALTKKEEIINLSLNIASQILAKELKKTSSMDALFEKALIEVKDRKTLVIKVNPKYKDSITKQISSLKDELSLTNDINVLGISSIQEGDLIIESEKGTVVTGVDTAFENIKAELL
jgi:flagellar assembly protein FliH